MASNIGLPDISVEFKNKGNTAFKRGNTGIVTLVLKDTKAGEIYEIEGIYDIPETLSEQNRKYVKLAFEGNVYAPKKVLVATIGKEGKFEDVAETLEGLEFNLLAMPEVLDEDKEKIKEFVVKMTQEVKHRIQVVLNVEDADCEYIINSTQDNVETKHFGILNKNEFCVYVAGFIAGTPLSQSITYATPKCVSNITTLKKSECDKKVKNGELILIKEAGAIRFARGVNSLVTTTKDKGQEFQKIKLISAMNLIHNDLRRLVIENYVGKVANTYDNKCLLITSINLYLQQLEVDEVVGKGFKVEIDIPANIKYLRECGIDVANMTEQEIKEANTKDKVFLKMKCCLIDAMEDIFIPIEI